MKCDWTRVATAILLAAAAALVEELTKPTRRTRGR